MLGSAGRPVDHDVPKCSRLRHGCVLLQAEKLPYVQRQQRDRDRYEREMEQCAPAPRMIRWSRAACKNEKRN